MCLSPRNTVDPLTECKHTAGKVSAPFEGANLLFSFFRGKMSYFETVAEQRFQNNLPSRVSMLFNPSGLRSGCQDLNLNHLQIPCVLDGFC